MADDDLLFDYMFLEAQDKEEENEKLREENEDLKEQLNKRKTSVADSEEDYDKVRFFAEDVQSIAADCGVEMEISYEEAIEFAGIANSYNNEKKANEIIGFSYIKLKNFNKAQRIFEALVEENPDNILFSATLTDIYFSKYNIGKAFGEMKRIKSINHNALSDDTYSKYKIFGTFLW